MTVEKRTIGLFAVLSLVACGASAAEPPSGKLSAEATRGRYLVQITGCNDCHTAGYAESGGQVEESKWLAGDMLGWRGPWGTTYPANLRLTVKDMTAEQFLTLARSPLRPPMPWFNLRDMQDSDVKAIYAYLRHLGPMGERAPAFVPPDKAPGGAFVKFPDPPKKPGT